MVEPVLGRYLRQVQLDTPYDQFILRKTAFVETNLLPLIFRSQL